MSQVFSPLFSTLILLYIFEKREPKSDKKEYYLFETVLIDFQIYYNHTNIIYS